MGFLDWLKETMWGGTERSDARMSIYESHTLTDLETKWQAMSATLKAEEGVNASYIATKKVLESRAKQGDDLVTQFMAGALDEWLSKIKGYETKDPVQARANLVKLTKDVMVTAGVTAGIDLVLGTLPNGLGTASSTNTKQILSWFGFGAVLAAVAHDPVKIGMIRPYQDSLEQSFQNRRPEERYLVAAAARGKMAATQYDTEMSKWGYPASFRQIMLDSSYRGLSFSNLMTIAKQGLYTSVLGLANLKQIGMTDASVAAADAVLIIANTQATDKAQAAALKAAASPVQKEKDLTVSQLQLAYQDNLIDRAKAKASIISLGYDAAETDMLLNIVELRKKTPPLSKLKKLTLTDYEKAYKNRIISLDAVLLRMQGEYAAQDIEIEKQLLITGKA